MADCTDVGQFKTQTFTTTTLVNDVLATDTTITVLGSSVVPDQGFGIFTGCNGDKVQSSCGKRYDYGCGCSGECGVDCTFRTVGRTSSCSTGPYTHPEQVEIFMWTSTGVDADGNVILEGLVRGLSPYGCNYNVSVPDNVIDHSVSEQLKLADNAIHYYDCIRNEILQSVCDRLTAGGL